MENGNFEINVNHIIKNALSDGAKTAISETTKDIITSYLEGDSEIDFQDIITEVIKATCKSLYGQTISDEVGKCLTNFIYGNNVFNNNKLGDIGIDGIEVWDKFNEIFDYGNAIINLKKHCEEVKSTSDANYYAAVKEVGEAFLDFADTFASSLPIIGDMMTYVFSTMKGLYNLGFDSVVDHVQFNDTQMALMALGTKDETSIFYLMSQKNLILDRDMLIAGQINMSVEDLIANEHSESIHGHIVTQLQLISGFTYDYDEEMKDNFLDNYASFFHLVYDESDLRQYCKDVLTQKYGYDFTNCTDDQIADYFSGRVTVNSNRITVDNVLRHGENFNRAQT